MAIADSCSISIFAFIYRCFIRNYVMIFFQNLICGFDVFKKSFHLRNT